MSQKFEINEPLCSVLHFTGYFVISQGDFLVQGKDWDMSKEAVFREWNYRYWSLYSNAALKGKN